MESRNPVFSRGRQNTAGSWGAPGPTPSQLQNMYDAPSYAPPTAPAYRTMTIDDVVVRSFMTLGTLVVAGAAAWYLNVGLGIAIGAALIGLVLGLIASFKQSTNPALILGYALFYGVFVGALSHYYESAFNGIVVQAVLGTALAFAAMLTVYSLRIIRVTSKFVRYVVGAAIGMIGLALVNWIVGFFVTGGLGLREAGPLGYVFSIAMILIGCFFLLLDFSAVEEGIKAGAPEKFAWQCAFGLTLTLVWIYLEVLRFLSYFRD
ncbi:Bax inhibitor-1/YccA family protein [Nonomuraea sp. NPDC050556]|uniref:Bax inhibitor-1/YccA family protein n=1 Tax=Nonomuraea sp. NPDC050556 TaxID=3364369 RepID=UPI0037967347